MPKGRRGLSDSLVPPQQNLPCTMEAGGKSNFPGKAAVETGRSSCHLRIRRTEGPKIPTAALVKTSPKSNPTCFTFTARTPPQLRKGRPCFRQGQIYSLPLLYRVQIPDSALMVLGNPWENCERCPLPPSCSRLKPVSDQDSLGFFCSLPKRGLIQSLRLPGIHRWASRDQLDGLGEEMYAAQGCCGVPACGGKPCFLDWLKA